MSFKDDIGAGIRCEPLIILHANPLAEEIGVHGKIFKPGVNKRVEIIDGKDFLNTIIYLKI